MSRRSVIQYVTGPAGTGKTYWRCARFLVDEWLPEHEGVHWSNFPLGLVPDDHIEPPAYEGETFADRIANYAAKKYKGDADSYRARIKLIPQEELARWQTGEATPGDFFAGKDISGAHIAIDEIHNYCSRNTDKRLRQRMSEWLGEIRHQGATIEFISQSPRKVAKEISDEAGVRIAISDASILRDPWFGITLGDWWQLKAKFITGKYNALSQVVEERERGFRWKKTHSETFRVDPSYFPLYDSFSRPQKGGSKGKSEQLPWERNGRLAFALWFLSRNLFRVTTRLLIIGAIVFALSGNGGVVVGWVQGAFQHGFGDLGRAEAQEVQQPESVTQPANTGGVASVQSTPREEALQAELDRLKGRMQKQSRELQNAERMLSRSSSVALLSGESVTFRGGWTYRVGERMEFGPYEGDTIESIDFPRRVVVLRSGNVLRLGRMPGEDVGPTDGPRVPTVVPGGNQ